MSLANVQPYPGIFTDKAGDWFRHGMQAQCWRTGDTQFSIIATAQIVGQRIDTAFCQNNGIGFLQDAFAKRGRHNPLPRTDHQLETQPSFHELHIAGQRRLRQPERCRGAGERARADDFVELQQMPWINDAHVASYQIAMHARK